MGAAATTLAPDWSRPSASRPTPRRRRVTVSAPAAGEHLAQGSLVTVRGTASDVGGAVAGVEVSVDGGASFHPADGTTTWTYTGILTGNGARRGPGASDRRLARTLRADDSIAVDSPCPCSLFGVAIPTDRRHRRRQQRHARHEVHPVQLRVTSRRPVLQVRRQHREPHRDPVHRQRRHAGDRDLRQRDSQRLADPDLPRPVAGRPRHDLHRRLPRARSATTRPTSPSSDRRATTAGAS